MKLEEIISHLDTIPYSSRNQVLSELENQGEVSAYMAEEIREYWDREDDRANLAYELKRENEMGGFFNLKGIC